MEDNLNKTDSKKCQYPKKFNKQDKYRTNKNNFKSHGGRQTGNRKRKFETKNTERNAKKSKPFDIGKRLSEVDIGVTEFISSYEGFIGIVKDKYSDFQVHEISLDGEVTKLTTFEIPKHESENISPEKLKESLPENIKTQIEDFVNNTEDNKTIEIDVTDCDKDTRRNIHKLSKTVSNVISQTVDKDNKKILIISKNNDKSAKGRQLRKDHRIDWSQREGDYCHFILHKVNLDTMDALNQIARNMRINSSFFGFAGTKDRRAKTSQWVSLKKGDPYLIEKAGKMTKGAFVGNFKFSKVQLKLGMLKGNQFTIALRNITANDESINLAMTSLRDNGFINYFGLQRFGTIASIPTYEIGKSLLQGNWKSAINLILKPREGEQDSNLAEARKIYEDTKDAEKALNQIERSDKIEAKLLRGITICGESNPHGALDFIPRNISLMYIHSYQSLVWNNIVSRRIKEFGLKPIVGDLVYVDKTSNEAENENLEENHLEDMLENEKMETFDEKEAENNGKEDSTEKGNEKEKEEIIKDSNDCNENNGKEDNTEKGNEKEKEEIIKDNNDCNENKTGLKDNSNKLNEKKEFPQVKSLNEEDLQNYTLADIVLPMPGWKVTYPSYAKTWYDEFLGKDGLNTDLKLTSKKYTLCGSYRNVIQFPTNLSWKMKHYNDRNDEIIASDLDEIRGVSTPTESEDAKYKALILKMSLPSSTYATSALREILKIDMSTQNQAAQSAAHI